VSFRRGSFHILKTMGSLSAARAEWEAATVPYPLPHKLSYGPVVEESFRKYGDAIALLEWTDDCTITKIETLKPRCGAAGQLLEFLKRLAVKHYIRITGNPITYPPTCPLAAQSPLSQEKLESWYRKHGFHVGWTTEGVLGLWYPEPPRPLARRSP
jgi:hypothetical protein